MTPSLPSLLLLALVFAWPAMADVQLLSAARIHTLDPAQPTVTAMAWDESGRVLAVGAMADLRRQYPRAQRIDAGSATVIPGLIDAHGHIMGLGFSLLRADLVGSASKPEVIARLRRFERSLPKQAWLLGRGWDQNRWPGREFPTAADLDAAFPDRPVWLERIDGHANWANSAAMKAAGRDFSGGWQPVGGRIERTADGNATGVFVDAAVELIEAVVPPPDAAQRERALTLALDAASRVGLTGAHDMGTSSTDLALFRRLADEGRLPLRITAYADGDHQALADLCAHGAYAHAGGRLRMPGVKLYIDGALGSRGAALLADYSDQPGQRGLFVTDPLTYAGIVRKASDCGLQIATHAIGDRGNRVVLDTYEQVLRSAPAADRRWRIEHAQVVALEDIPRFHTLNVIASMQPTHATSDMPWAERRLGPERLAGAYAWQRMLAAGVRLALGSDFPVESVDPRLGLYAGVTRQDLKGQPPGGWLPDQRLSASEVLRGFTADAAYAGFAEHEVGMLKPGLRADFLILREDPLTMPAAKLAVLGIRSTWVDGRAVYRAR